MKYDAEEQFILDAFEKDEIKLSDPSKDDLKAAKAAARNTFKKDKRVTISLHEHDFAGIQKKALEMGMPCQTLISSIIHRYVEGNIKVNPT